MLHASAFERPHLCRRLATRVAEYRWNIQVVGVNRLVVSSSSQSFLLVMHQLGARILATQPRSDNADAQVFAHGFIVSRTKDDGCVFSGVAADGFHDFASFTHFQ